jgi:hypothetical protein
MNASAWIALSGLAFTVVVAVAGAAVYIGRVIGRQPGMMAETIRDHERGCSNYDPNSSVRQQESP